MKLNPLVFPISLVVVAMSASNSFAGVEAVEASRVPVGNYEIDPSHASVQARVDHFGFSTTIVRFPKVSGRFAFDPAHAEASSLDVTLDAGALSSDWEARDAELKGAGFFNVAKFPTIRFSSNALTKVDASHAKVDGQLTLLGVTRPVQIDVTLLGTGTGMMGDRRAGFAAHTSINRSDFGMKTFLPAIGDKVDIVIDVEFSKK
jgi:polyisoprenoid-binding protein YceI